MSLKLATVDAPMALPRSTRFFTCGLCGWYRDLVTDARWQKRKILVPLYGHTTYAKLATLDVANHSCAVYLDRRERRLNHDGRLTYRLD